MDIKIIQDLVKNKKILLIGNGQCDDSTFKDYNIVIRMNNGIIKGYADIWVNNLIQFNKRTFDWNKIKFKYMLRLNAEKNGEKLLRGYPERYRATTYFWNPQDYLKFSKEVGYTQPFTGTTALHWLNTNTEPESITIIGMDFFKNGKYSPAHNPDLDRQYVDNIIKHNTRICRR